MWKRLKGWDWQSGNNVYVQERTLAFCATSIWFYSLTAFHLLPLNSSFGKFELAFTVMIDRLRDQNDLCNILVFLLRHCKYCVTSNPYRISQGNEMKLHITCNLATFSLDFSIPPLISYRVLPTHQNITIGPILLPTTSVGSDGQFR